MCPELSLRLLPGGDKAGQTLHYRPPNPTLRLASGNFTQDNCVKRTGSIGLATLIWHRFETFYTTGLIRRKP